jgi:ribonucleoside-diphosphate reductase alpha chain
VTTTSFGLPETIRKRFGAEVDFDIDRITNAVQKCYDSLDETPATPVEVIVDNVASALSYKWSATGKVPTVEEIQDLVEVTLVGHGEYEAAKHYILYRERHAKNRASRVPQEIRDVFADSASYFPTALQQFQFFDKYSRYDWDLGRRETWVETVDRVMDYLRWLVESLHGSHLESEVYETVRTAMLLQEAMPSMRALSQAGEAAKRNGLAIYNCSYSPVDSLDTFVETLQISMAGCGVGYSVERQYVEQLPRVQRQKGGKAHYHEIEDSSDGWAAALRFGLECWFKGEDVVFDYLGIRPAGSPLKIKGGRASGPDPLKFVLDFCRSKILSRQGTTLRTVDAHDIMCVIGGAAVSGGVRRTAMICLYSWDDTEMRDCKSGAFPEYRWNANNSAVWPEVMSQIEFTDQMMAMIREGRGEPGIFSRANAIATLPERRQPADFGTNPCGEINLRPRGLCNLSIAVARHDDTVEDLYRKVEIASILGTIQSLATNFPEDLRSEWVTNCIEERLLGVDITGQADCPLLDRNTPEGEALRQNLKRHSIAVNAEFAQRLGINQSAAVTCNKPSGNSSQLLNTSSGIHRRWAPYYIRRTRVSTSTPIFKVLQDAGVPLRPENGSSPLNANTWVASWPVKSPDGALTRKDFSAVDQCDFWLLNKVHWTEHNPSVTITYQADEILDMLKWVWDHKDLIGGMAFLPADDADYAQPPYEEIDEETYNRLVAEFPADIDFSLLALYEQTDMTEAAQLIACGVGGADC